ncbi:MAG: peptidyl-prolyl cis-trans isomerase SurA [Saprospiraceae bacterium]|jgi:peptidyl-prolyl cis-trans isomerase SurA
MKRFILILMLAGFPLLMMAQNKAIIDKVIAIVGNELILLSDVEEQYELATKQQGVLPEGFKGVILENLLADRLLLNQSRLDSILVSDDEVESQLQARIDQILAYMNNDMSQFEAYYGQSISDVKETFRADLENQLLVQRMRSSIIADVNVTPSEVKEFFFSIPVDSLPYFNSEVEIGEIVLKPTVNDEQKEISRLKLEEIRRRIVVDGEDLSELAKIYSDDPASARIGGDLGRQRRGTFVPEFEAAAYNLEKDSISWVFESEFGFHIVQLIDRRGNNIHTKHILIRPLITQEDLKLAKNTLKKVRGLVQHDSLSFSRAVKLYSDKNIQSFNNDGMLVNPNTGKSIFETGDLEPDIYFAVDSMKIGSISAPIEFTDRDGSVGYRLILLKSRTIPHVANLGQDYSKIKAAATESKTSIYVNDWVLSKIRSTYIKIDPMFQGYESLGIWLNKGIMAP